MLKIITQSDFLGTRAPSPTPDQARLCQWTPWRDVACLLRLCELHRPKRFLEVGCNVGGTTFLLAEQFPGMRLTAIDPGDSVMPFERSPVQRSEYLAQERIGELVKHRGVAVYRVRFDELPAIGTFDGIFIDGDHRADAVRRDVDKALSLLNPGGFIAAHDCGNPLTPDVERVLAESPLEFTRVDNSWIAFSC